MNEFDLYMSIGEVDDTVLERSERVSKKVPLWIRWCAAAACLCIVIAICIPVLHSRGNTVSKDPLTGDSARLEYNGCWYETVDDPKLLQIYGLPKKITKAMAGERVAYVGISYDEGYTVFKTTPQKTDIELYTYAPAPSDAVYIWREGDVYLAAVFCNFEMFSDSNTNYELSELYRVYGLTSPDDIISITETDWHRDKVVGNNIKDSGEIQAFYDLTLRLDSYGNDDFQSLMFGSYETEEAQEQVHIAYAEDNRVLRIECSNGLMFYLSLHPSFGWMSASGTMSYYRINEELQGWIDSNLN